MKALIGLGLILFSTAAYAQDKLDMVMTLPCQQNVYDSQIILDGRYLPVNAQYVILHYTVQKPSDGVWTAGACDIQIVGQIGG